MPNLRQAKKALRQSLRRAERNQVIRAEIHSMRRRFRKLLESSQFEDAKKMIPELQKKLDKAVVKNIYSANKSARLNSRLMHALKRAQGEEKTAE